MFSKRHYEYLARWLDTAAIATTDPMARNLFASSLADRLAADNSRFKRDKFMAAAGCDRRTAERARRAA